MNRFPDFILVVSVGFNNRDSLLFIKRVKGRNNSRLFQPNIENNITYVRNVMNQIYNKNLTGHTEWNPHPIINRAFGSDYVRSEINEFLTNNYEPFDISNPRKLEYYK